MLLLTFCCPMPSFLPHDQYRLQEDVWFYDIWILHVACSDRLSRLKPPGIFWIFCDHHALQGTPRVEAWGGRNVHLTLFSLERILCCHSCNCKLPAFTFLSSVYPSLVRLSVLIFPFHAFLHVYQFGQVTCVFPRLCLAVDFSLLLG